MKRDDIIRDFAMLFDMPQSKVRESIKWLPTDRLFEGSGLFAEEKAEKYEAFLRLRRAAPKETAFRASSPGAVANFVKENLDIDPHVEQFIVMGLNVKNDLLFCEIVSLGIATEAIVHPRETFQRAIRERASALIVAHNHPSGDPTPSASDFEITEKLFQSGEILGIPLLDHVVIGEHEHYSFKAYGHLEKTRQRIAYTNSR